MQQVLPMLQPECALLHPLQLSPEMLPEPAARRVPATGCRKASGPAARSRARKKTVPSAAQLATQVLSGDTATQVTAACRRACQKESTKLR